MSTEGGLFVPPAFENNRYYSVDVNIASIFLGIQITMASCTIVKGIQQTQLARGCGKGRAREYIVMIWGLWLACLANGLMNWLCLAGVIGASLGLYFAMVTMYCFQVQFLTQIIINRISLLVVQSRRLRRVKWITFAIIVVINISVFIVWIPARLDVSATWVAVNRVWDRMEKSLFLLVDASLNVLFLNIIRIRLHDNGFVELKVLFRFSVGMVVTSILLDIILIGLMCLPILDTFIQFQSFAYTAKLLIELYMADLIDGIARTSNGKQRSSPSLPDSENNIDNVLRPDTIFCGQSRFAGSTPSSCAASTVHTSRTRDEYFPNYSVQVRAGCSREEQRRQRPGCITKTVTMTITTESMIEAEDEFNEQRRDSLQQSLQSLEDQQERGECSHRPSLTPILERETPP